MTFSDNDIDRYAGDGFAQKRQTEHFNAFDLSFAAREPADAAASPAPATRALVLMKSRRVGWLALRHRGRLWKFPFLIAAPSPISESTARPP